MLLRSFPVWEYETRMTNMYSKALAAYLRRTGTSQATLAAKIGCNQPSVHRLVTGVRLPRKELARNIEKATEGEVPFALWQTAKIEQLGILT
jgi:DNA-binding transcriptional regulator YdaS (Cro superfamily)